MAMSADQQNRLHELGHMAGALAGNTATMSDEQRASLERQMENMQKAFNSDMEASHARLSEKLNKSLKVAEARRKADLATRLSGADLQVKIEKSGMPPARALTPIRRRPTRPCAW